MRLAPGWLLEPVWAALLPEVEARFEVKEQVGDRDAHKFWCEVNLKGLAPKPSSIPKRFREGLLDFAGGLHKWLRIGSTRAGKVGQGMRKLLNELIQHVRNMEAEQLLSSKGFEGLTELLDGLADTDLKNEIWRLLKREARRRRQRHRLARGKMPRSAAKKRRRELGCEGPAAYDGESTGKSEIIEVL